MKKQNGITLIALIITIIVMLILVAVTVVATVESGLFGNVGKATRGYNEAQTNEMDIDNKITSEGVTGLNNIINHYTDGV